MADANQLAEALRNLLRRDERNTCQHEETHRGGVLWEICDACGMKWADDEGGKPDWQDPPEWDKARQALAAYEAQESQRSCSALAAEPTMSPKQTSGTSEPVGEVQTYTGSILDGVSAPFNRVVWKDGIQPPPGTKLYAAPVAQAEPAWLPIETAPKDFVTEFDGWNGERIPNVSWALPSHSAKGEYAWCISVYETHFGWVNERVKGLTHWMPLPQPPKEQP